MSDVFLKAIYKRDLDQIKKFIKCGYIEFYIYQCEHNDTRLKFGRTKLHLVFYLCNLFPEETDLLNLAYSLVKEEIFPFNRDEFGKTPHDYFKGAPWGNDPHIESIDYTVDDILRDQICSTKKQILDAENNFERDQEEIDGFSYEIIQVLIENLGDTIPIMEQILKYIKWENDSHIDSIYYKVTDNLRDQICSTKKQILDAENNFERDQEEIGGFGYEIIQVLIENLRDTIPIMEQTLEYIKD